MAWYITRMIDFPITELFDDSLGDRLVLIPMQPRKVRKQQGQAAAKAAQITVLRQNSSIFGSDVRCAKLRASRNRR
jgi:hypothetical protein